MSLQEEQTRFCKICFNKISDYSFNSFLHHDNYICEKCMLRLKPIFYEFLIDDIKGLSIYEYNDEIKEKLFLFKGCYDYELKNCFINQYKHILNAKYRGFYMVFVPSSENSDKKRGFNHVEEMFSCLNLKRLKILKKANDEKQAEKNYFERKKNTNSLKLISHESLENKKILIVDDICTTGTTLENAIRLIKTLNPKETKILVMAKRILTEQEVKKYHIQNGMDKN